jgi:hypothetical protein
MVQEVKILETRKRVLGQQHPDTLISMSNLALTLWTLERWEEAEKQQTEAIDLLRTTIGEDHPITVNAIDILASFHEKHVDTAAVVGCEEVFEGLRETGNAGVLDDEER